MSNQTFNKDFLDMLKLFRDNNVRYMIIGGYAVGAHGYARATKDIDLWIDPTMQNASKVLSALKEFGYPVEYYNINHDTLIDTSNIIQIGVPPRRIDIMSGPEGIDFETAWGNKCSTYIDNVLVYYIGLKDLIIQKAISGRDRDKLDIKNLIKKI